MKVSNCCSAQETSHYTEDWGICPKCKEPCTFVDPDDEDEDDDHNQKICGMPLLMWIAILG